MHRKHPVLLLLRLKSNDESFKFYMDCKIFFSPEKPANRMKTLEDVPPCWYNVKITGGATVCDTFDTVETAAELPFLNKIFWKEKSVKA